MSARTWDPEGRFDAVLADVLGNDELRQSVDEAPVSEQELAARVRAKREEILRNAGPEIVLVGSLSEQLRDLEVQYGTSDAPDSPAPPDMPSSRQSSRGQRKASQRSSVDRLMDPSSDLAIAERRRELEVELASAEARADQLLWSALQEELRKVLNDFAEGKAQTRLRLERTDGLGQVVSERLEVRTKAADDLAALLKRMRGGSVGISGSRGAGKTTLMSRFCEGREPIGDKEQLSVQIPAPVAYDSREFMLHLFAELSAAVLSRDPLSTSGPGPGGRGAASGGMSEVVLGAITVAGAIGGLAGLAAAAAAAQSMIDDQLIWGVAAVLGGLTLFLIRYPIIEALSAFVGSSSVRIFLGRLLGVYLGAALCLVGAVIVLVELLGWSTPDSALRASVIVIVGAALALSARDALRTSSALASSRFSGIDSLTDLASFKLEEIRYQQTYSHGWSGGIKVPVGLEAGATSGETLARHPMTFPEVVGQLRRFLALASDRYDVIIGIDELDKLEADQTADRFLNDMKAAFGIPGTYFIVAVSEDALARFERRGMPLRDVFDSTFDEIVRVEPLSLRESQALLDQRLVGLPLIYSGLCHVISAGLPRDLIRTARRLVEMQDRLGGAADLASLTEALAAEELAAKIGAVAFAARQSDAPDPLPANLLSWLDELAGDIGNGDALLGRSGRLSELSTSVLPSARLDKDERRSRAQLLRMGLEVGTYAYFLCTAVQFFRDPMSAEGIRTAADGTRQDPTLALLARARADFTVNPQTAWSRVNDFRVKAAISPILDPPNTPMTHSQRIPGRTPGAQG